MNFSKNGKGKNLSQLVFAQGAENHKTPVKIAAHISLIQQSCQSWLPTR